MKAGICGVFLALISKCLPGLLEGHGFCSRAVWSEVWAHFVSRLQCYVCNFVDAETRCLQQGGKSLQHAVNSFVCCGSGCPAPPAAPSCPDNGLVARKPSWHPAEGRLLCIVALLEGSPTKCSEPVVLHGAEMPKKSAVSAVLWNNLCVS